MHKIEHTAPPLNHIEFNFIYLYGYEKKKKKIYTPWTLIYCMCYVRWDDTQPFNKICLIILKHEKIGIVLYALYWMFHVRHVALHATYFFNAFLNSTWTFFGPFFFSLNLFCLFVFREQWNISVKPKKKLKKIYNE